MSRDNREVTYLTDSEKRQLADFMHGLDKSKAEVLRTALMEYIDRDKATRIEHKIDDLHDKIDAMAGESENSDSHTHTSGSASKTVTRMRKIAERVYDNHGDVIKTADVERAIEDIAGGDSRTTDKYKTMLKQRGLLYEHPADSVVWTPDRETWEKWAESYVDTTPSATVYTVTEDYSISAEELGGEDGEKVDA